jgi:uncharacterized protein YkwD
MSHTDRMRKVLASLTVLAATLAVAPASTAASPAGGGAERATTATDRAGAIDALRRGVVNRTNDRRRNHGCNDVRRNGALDRSHELPGEASLGVRVRRAGYDWTMLGENVAAGYRTPASVVRGWMHSAGHRRNILNCRYRHIGVGYAVSDRGTPYWTQVFGRR